MEHLQRRYHCPQRGSRLSTLMLYIFERLTRIYSLRPFFNPNPEALLSVVHYSLAPNSAQTRSFIEFLLATLPLTTPYHKSHNKTRRFGHDLSKVMFCVLHLLMPSIGQVCSPGSHSSQVLTTHSWHDGLRPASTACPHLEQKPNSTPFPLRYAETSRR